MVLPPVAFAQYTVEVIGNTLISRMLQIVLSSWKKDQSINVVDCHIDGGDINQPKKPAHPPDRAAREAALEICALQAPISRRTSGIKGWGLVERCS